MHGPSRDRWLRARAAALWGLENGFTVVHSSRDGVLSVSDRYGRFGGAIPSDSAPVATLLVAAPLAPGAPTPYALLGDWFGWLCVAACAMALGPLRRGQATRAKAPPAAVSTAPGEISARRWPARR